MKGQALIDAIVAKATHLTKARRQFLSHILMLFLSVRHRINFSQLARHTDQYCEHSMRLQFEQFIDFAQINQALIQQRGSGHFLMALDASYRERQNYLETLIGKVQTCTMKKRVTIREPDRLERFMNSFQHNHSEDFKALALHLVTTSDIHTVARQTGVPISTLTLYDWQDYWTDGGKVEGQNPA